MESDGKMEYVYAALMLHGASQEISEENVKKIVGATGASVDELKVKQLVAALQGVNIDEAIKQAAVAAVAAPAGEKKEEKKEEKKDEAASEEQAAAGLAALFG